MLTSCLKETSKFEPDHDAETSYGLVGGDCLAVIVWVVLNSDLLPNCVNACNLTEYEPGFTGIENIPVAFRFPFN